MKWKNEKENLIKLISQNKPYEEIGRIYNCTGSNIRKVCIRLGIELKQKRKINPNETFNKGTAKKDKCIYCGNTYIKYKGHRGKYCSKECFNKHKIEQNIEDWKKGKISGCDKRFRLSTFVKKYIFEKNNNCCEKCGNEYINPYTHLSVLQIHHIDGDCTNNKEENLQLLCPTCHSLTENFGSRNKGSNRTYRKKEYRKENTPIV